MKAWRRFHEWRWFVRWPIKLIAFALVVGLTLYPKPWLLPEQSRRLGNLEGLIDPDAPGMAELERAVEARLQPDTEPEKALAVVEDTVYQRVPYAFDWETWGVVEYMPTAAEVLERGREDCDGRAVVAASLLRRLGYRSELVADMLHMWVVADRGGEQHEIMSPTGGAKTLRSGPGPAESVFSLGMLNNLCRGTSFGVAVYPLRRELVIIAALILVTLNPRSAGWRSVAACLLLWIGLDAVREFGESAARYGGLSAVARTAAGFGVFVVGWLLLAIKAPARRPDCEPAPLE